MNRLSAFIGASGGLVPIQHGLHALFGGRAANCDQQKDWLLVLRRVCGV